MSSINDNAPETPTNTTPSGVNRGSADRLADDLITKFQRAVSDYSGSSSTIDMVKNKSVMTGLLGLLEKVMPTTSLGAQGTMERSALDIHGPNMPGGQAALMTAGAAKSNAEQKALETPAEIASKKAMADYYGYKAKAFDDIPSPLYTAMLKMAGGDPNDPDAKPDMDRLHTMISDYRQNKSKAGGAIQGKTLSAEQAKAYTKQYGSKEKGMAAAKKDGFTW
jgi:hypothetical protein